MAKSNTNPDLSDVEWPKDAENQTFTLKQVSCQGDHFFMGTKKANEVKCKCGIGYLITGMDLKEGHIYYDGELVI